MSTANQRKFKLEVNFGASIKSKTFTVIGFNPVNEAARPVGTKPGINYHPNDPSKATLVLHAPTYTRYKKEQVLFQEHPPPIPKVQCMLSVILITGLHLNLIN